MKTSTVVIGVGVAVVAVVAYRHFSKSTAQRRVDDYAAGYGSGSEPQPPPRTWNGTAWVPSTPFDASTDAGFARPADVPSAGGGGGLDAAAWAAVRASSAKVPRVGTTADLLPVELMTLQKFNPPA